MGVFKKLLSAVSVTLTATIAFTFPVQAVAANLSKFSSAKKMIQKTLLSVNWFLNEMSTQSILE